MNYTASVSDFFKSPKWMMNLLLAGVCGFIPIVGPMVIKGWLVTGFWGRDEGRPETFPEFDFNKFMTYLERGLWPFLVALVGSFAIVIVAAVVIVPIMVGFSFLAPANDSAGGDAVAAIMLAFVVVAYLRDALAMMLLLTPLTVRAALMQDFAPAFSFGFLKRFLALTWKESLLASLFLAFAGLVSAFAGALLLCIGMYFAVGLISFCGEHLHKQLYRLYLSRGGDPVPVSLKLWDGPPPPPPAPL
jgi:hypothetical protein